MPDTRRREVRCTASRRAIGTVPAPVAGMNDYDDPIPWLLLDLAHPMPEGPLRDLLRALADAWEELPFQWRAFLRAVLA